MPEGPIPAEVLAASRAFTLAINPHLGGEELEDEISSLCETGMPEALAAASATDHLKDHALFTLVDDWRKTSKPRRDMH